MSLFKRRKKLLIGLLAMASMCCLTVGGVCAQGNKMVNAQADNGFALEFEVPAQLSKGDVLNVPKGMFGDTVATAYVTAPDGNVYASDTLNIQKHGMYKIQYSAVVDGKILLHEETVTVENTAYTFKSDKSTAQYVENQAIAKRDGLLVNLTQGDTFTFNQAIDLNNFKASNPSVLFTVIPQKEGAFDVKTTTITFTDLYDSNNKAQIKFFHSQSEESFWNPCLARANSQTWKGIDNTQSTPYIWVNAYGHYYNFYAKNNFSYNGNVVNNIFENQYLGAHVNVETNEMCIAWKAFLQNLDVSGTAIDLDDASYQEEIFDGFTTGEVLVSVECEGYAQPTAQLLFLRLGDADLTSESVTDENPPVISFSEDIDATVEGVTGGSFPIFNAVGIDGESDGYVDVKARVYYGYGRDEGVYHTVSDKYIKEISVVNGRFKTDKAGKYSICYSAIDYSGNYTERVVNINVSNADAAITDIYLEEGYTTAVQCGNWVDLAKVTDYEGGYRDFGGRDDITINYIITKDGKKIDYTGNEIIGYSFIPKEEGTYVVSITLIDYVGNEKTVSYNITVSRQTTPAFAEKISLPKYIIEGAEYVLPDVMGKNANGTEVKASVTTNDGNGLRKYTSGSKVKFLADRRGNTTITYTLGNEKKTFEIPVISLLNGKQINASKYFVGENFTASVESKGVLLNLSGDANVDFINALVDEVFTATFELGGFGENFTEFTIGLTDSENISERVEMTFLYNGKGVDVYVNGEIRQKNFFSNLLTSKEIIVGWDAATASWTIGSSLRFEMGESVYGLAFDGFTSRKVYMDFSAKTNGTDASIFVKKIINQDMGTISKSDNRQPELILEDSYNELIRGQGSVLDLFSAVGGDVLSPYCSVTLTVTFNDKTVKSVDGIDLSKVDCSNGKSYQVELSEYGEYTITYTATDWNNKVKSIALLMKSADFEAPVLKVDSNYTVKDGKITLSEVAVTDNYSLEIAIYTTVITPSGKIIYVKDNTFSVEEKGDYIITIMAMDEFGNCAEVQQMITVD